MDDRHEPRHSTEHDFSGIGKLRPHESEFEAALAQRMQACVRGADFPLEVQFAMDYFLDDGELRCRTRVLPSAPPTWPAPVMTVEASYRFSHEQFRDVVIERLQRGVLRDRRVSMSLVRLARIDLDRFYDTAAELFAERLESVENELDGVERLPLFVLFLHDIHPEVPATLVTHTKARSPRAAARLRGLLLDAMDEPECAEELGLLAAQTLRERLEEA